MSNIILDDEIGVTCEFLSISTLAAPPSSANEGIFLALRLNMDQAKNALEALMREIIYGMVICSYGKRIPYWASLKNSSPKCIRNY